MSHKCLVPLVLLAAVALLAGCGADSNDPARKPLNPGNVNLIFVVSEDLADNAPGDVSPATANLTNQGLHRSLLMATYLRDQVLGAENATAIYALIPMSHRQTAGRYPDMAALETVQQFALLNQMTLASAPGAASFTGNSFPINASYAPEAVPPDVVAPTPLLPCDDCVGLEFDDSGGRNAGRATGIINAHVPGFYVFSAPWTTTRRLLHDIERTQGYRLHVPARYASPNTVYAITVTPAGDASLVTYAGKLDPSPTEPVLTPPLPRLAACAAAPFTITATDGVDGVVVPADVNRNQTLYIVRHAEAHPTSYYGDGNYVAAGQWRALGLAGALRGKVQPTRVYSTDPAQVTEGSVSASGNVYWSNVAPALTVQPYAIANDLPYELVTQFLIADPDSPQDTSDYFFRGGKLSGTSALLGWQFAQIPLTLTALLASYNYTGPAVPSWSSVDYDSVWTVKLDAGGNLTVDNSLCEGIDSAQLPATAPQY